MITNSISCDKCGIVGFESTGPNRMPVNMMRTLLRVNGWLVGEKGGKDYCPICRQIRLDKSVTITPEKWHDYLRKARSLKRYGKEGD